MSYLKLAEEEARKQKEAKAAKEERQKREREANESWRIHYQKEVDKVLDELSGVGGLERRGVFLKKNGVVVAKVEVMWQQWSNPNFDYVVDEEGYLPYWQIYEGVRVVECGMNLEVFAKSIGRRFL